MNKIKPLSAISNGALLTEALPTRIKVLGWGKNITLDEPIYLDERSIAVFDINQKKIGGGKIALDFDHCTVPDSGEFEKGKPKSIAAYGNPRIIEGDGLWLENLQWTPLGEENARNYADLSPAPILKDGLVIGMHSVGLTPRGAIEDLSFYSADKPNKNMDDKKDKLKNHLDNDNDIDESKEHMEKDKESIDEDTDSDESTSMYAEDKEMVSDKENKEEDKEENDDTLCDECAKKFTSKFFTKINSVVEDGNENKTAVYSADNQNKYMDENIVKLANELTNIPSAAEIAKRLEAWKAEFEGVKKVASPITGDPKPVVFSAEFSTLMERVKTLEADKNESIARFSAMEKQSIINEATKNGKVVPFSAEEILELTPKTLKSVIEKITASVPLKATTKIFSAGQKPETKSTLTDAARAIQEQVDSLLTK